MTRPPWHEEFPLTKPLDMRDDTAPPTFDGAGMYREPETVSETIRCGENFASVQTLWQACDLIEIILEAAPALARGYQDQAREFVRRHGRTIHQTIDDSRP